VTDVAAFSFNKLVIFGVGLIGGSLARALRERGEADGARTVVGVGRSAQSSARARAGTRRDRQRGGIA